MISFRSSNDPPFAFEESDVLVKAELPFLGNLDSGQEKDDVQVFHRSRCIVFAISKILKLFPV